MSYARMGPDSDVYVFKCVGGGWECCNCNIGRWRFTAAKPSDMIEHLKEHFAQGDKVPDYCFEGLQMDVQRMGNG